MLYKSMPVRIMLLIGGLFASSSLSAFPSCDSICTGNQDACDTRCMVEVRAGEPELRTCQQYYLNFATGTNNINFVTRGNIVCDMKDKLTWGGVKVDFMVEDTYVRKCNPSVVSYQRREVADVSCGYLSFTPGTQCGEKIRDKFDFLATQGIFPHPDLPSSGDRCPTLR